jgi:hypothetical protein
MTEDASSVPTSQEGIGETRPIQPTAWDEAIECVTALEAQDRAETESLR